VTTADIQAAERKLLQTIDMLISKKKRIMMLERQKTKTQVFVLT
jgi:hypothetical protein